MTTATDLMLAMLADDACALRAELVVYRELCQVALAHLQEAEARQAGLTAQLGAMREEIRRYTAARVEAAL
jgi:hypothetical protein